MTLHWSASVSLWLIVALFPIGGPVVAQTPRIQNEDANGQILTGAIKGLASDDETDRETSRATLLGMGQAAIYPLLDLLPSLTPAFKLCPPGTNLACHTGIRPSDSPKTRMREEVISLLGQLRAVAAVPLLIKILGLWDSEGAGLGYWGPETNALVEIGSPAIPELLDTLRQAEEKRHNDPLSNGHLAAYLEIEIRILDVLGRIGDERALMFLLTLKESNTNSHFQAYLKAAEERIKERMRQR